MKANRFIIAAALTLMGLTACTSEDNIIVEKPTANGDPREATVYHVSITATLGDEAQTRAVNPDGNTISVAFDASENIYVYNVTKGCFACNSSHGAIALNPTDISADGKRCKLEGNLTFYKFNGSSWESVTVGEGDTYTLYYGLSPNTQTPSNSLFEYDTQAGTKDGLSNCDYGMSTGVTMTQSGEKLSPSGTVTFTLNQSMFRQTLTFKDGETTVTPTITDIDVTTANGTLVWHYLPLATGDAVYNRNTVDLYIPTEGAQFSELYLALTFHYDATHPAAGDQLIVTATDENGKIYVCKKNVPSGGFENGKYYYGSMVMTKTF